jgi:hypothetical protein
MEKCVEVKQKEKKFEELTRIPGCAWTNCLLHFAEAK